MSLWVYGLTLTLVMYNCKKKDEPFPTEPDSELVKEINAIDMETVTLVQPVAVTTTPSSLVVSAKATEVAGALSTLSSGTVPPTVQTASNDMNAALTSAELNTLAAVTPATINDIAGGGALPANLKAIMDKVMANPALLAYLPKMTLPTVNGKTVSGRTGTPESVEKVDGIEIEDACLIAAQAAFDAVKTKLDAKKATQDAQIAAAYSAAIAPLAAEQASCTSGIPATYATMRTAAQAQATSSLNDLEAAKSVIPAGLYVAIKAFINIQLLNFLSSVNTLQAADLKACSEKTAAATAAAAAARDANTAAVNASYNAAIAKATTKKGELAQSCHNQGGGR